MDGASDQPPSKTGKSPEEFVAGERADENAGEDEEKVGEEQPDDGRNCSRGELKGDCN
jgi:hypothetical protein